MKTLQFNSNAKGNLVLSDTGTGELFYPSDSDGNFLDFVPEQYLSIKFVSNGTEIFPLSFLSEGGLGWLANAINAIASIGSSIFSNKASKEANQSAERQLQAQQQIELLRAERQAALINQPQAGFSTGTMVAIGVAGAAIIGSLIYLVSSNQKEGNQMEVEVKPKKATNKKAR